MDFDGAGDRVTNWTTPFFDIFDLLFKLFLCLGYRVGVCYVIDNGLKLGDIERNWLAELGKLDAWLGG